mgnify:CR=1 FL=1
MIILKENIVRAQLSNVICPTCESKVKGRRVPNSTNKNTGSWKKDFAWQVFSDTRPVTYYHLICYTPETHDGKEELEYWKELYGIESDKKTKRKTQRSRQMTKPKGLLANLFKNPKIKSKPNETDDESDDLDGQLVLVGDMENALEHPEDNIDDEELKEIIMERDKLDLPIQWQGQFAVVYKGELKKSMYALRLFRNNNKDLMQRYSDLQDYFEKNKIFTECPYFIRFEYKPDAIYIKFRVNRNDVKEKPFDIIKMEWVEGDVLQDFIKNTDDKKRIKILADKFLDMVMELESLGIAHGDLHPKNVMVHNDQLRLVDYDCIFIKDFQGQDEPEDGDQDCQHPKRKNFVYDQKIDRFSALVIYLGLLAISENIELKLHRGEEFIFARSDFLDPSVSPLFKILDGMSDKIKSLSSKLQKYCKKDKPNIGSLQENGLI